MKFNLACEKTVHKGKNNEKQQDAENTMGVRKTSQVREKGKAVLFV